MSREVRKVPANWEHPRNHKGDYLPLHDEDYESAAAEWIANFDAWRSRAHPDYARNQNLFPNYWEWAGNPPERDDYRPKWTDAERTHYMMYETTSEGTPISPAFATPEELARWLADTKASAFAGKPASYEHWLTVARGAWCPSAVIDARGMMSGVEFVGEEARKKE